MRDFTLLTLFLAFLASAVLADNGDTSQGLEIALKAWGVANVTELEMAKNGTHPNYHMKDVIRRCKNFQLQASTNPISSAISLTANRLFAKAECKGIYGAPNDFRCTYINLDLCLKIDSGGFRKRALGRPFVQNLCQAQNCQMHNDTHGKCQGCRTGPNNGDWEYFNLNGVLDSELGFLTCYGRSGFQCPVGDEPMPY